MRSKNSLLSLDFSSGPSLDRSLGHRLGTRHIFVSFVNSMKMLVTFFSRGTVYRRDFCNTNLHSKSLHIHMAKCHYRPVTCRQRWYSYTWKPIVDKSLIVGRKKINQTSSLDDCFVDIELLVWHFAGEWQEKSILKQCIRFRHFSIISSYAGAT